MRRLTGIDSDESLWERWLECEAVRHFERGTTSPEEFASGMVAEWQLPITPEDFLRDFRGDTIHPSRVLQSLSRTSVRGRPLHV